MTAPDVSVQICTYNRGSRVRACLDALARQTWPAARFEVVLVDDGSDEPVANLLQPPDYPFSLRPIRVPHGGLARARNAGIRAAAGALVLFIDDDTIADDRLIEEHWNDHQRHPHAVVLGWVNHVDPDRAPGRRRRPRLADLSTSFFWTSNASVRRDDLLRAGLFDEAFTEYGWEDVEFGERLRTAGLVRRFNRRAIVSHVKPARRGRDVAGMLEQAAASGRSAVRFVSRQPVLRARLATGLTPVRMRVNRLMEPAETWCRERAEHAGDQVLTGPQRVLAYAATRAAYFRAARGALAARLAPASWSNIVVVRTDRIGDLLVSTPAIRALRTALPGARITLLVNSTCADVLDGWDAIDAIETADLAAGRRERQRVVEALRARRPEAVFVLTPSAAMYLLARQTGAPVRVGFGYRSRPLDAAVARFALTHPVLGAVPETAARAAEIRHHAEEILALVDAVGLPAAARPIEVPIAPQDRDWANAAAVAGTPRPPIALHLSEKWLDEGWSANDVIALVDALSHLDEQCRLTITVGPSDAGIYQALARSLAGRAPRVLVFDHLTFGRWAALLARSAVVVSPDTGAVHVASATGRPVVGVYAAERFHVLSRQWAPWMVPNRIVRKDRGMPGVQAIATAAASLLAEGCPTA